MMKSRAKSSATLPIHPFERQKEWAAWLKENHNTSPGVWLQLAKKAAEIESISYNEAVEVALALRKGTSMSHSACLARSGPTNQSTRPARKNTRAGDFKI